MIFLKIECGINQTITQFKKMMIEKSEIMSKAIDPQKDNDVLKYIQIKQYATIEEICQALYISQATARRRLQELQDAGLIIRTRGGAKVVETNNFLPTFTFRSHQNSIEKKKIAMLGAGLIKDGDYVFLDGSTSAFFISEYLSGFKNLKVMTNGIDTLSQLSKNGIDAYSTGGRVSSENRSVLVGPVAKKTVSDFRANIVFFSANAVTPEGELIDVFEEENELRQLMMQRSDKRSSSATAVSSSAAPLTSSAR